MAQHTKEVTMGGDTFEVVYDDSSNLVYKRETAESILSSIFEPAVEQLNDANTVGRTEHDPRDDIRRYAERYDVPVGEMSVTAKYLGDLVDALAEDVPEYAPVTVTAADSLPLVVTTPYFDGAFVLTPRVSEYPHER